MEIKITAKYRNKDIIVTCITIYKDGSYSIDNATTLDGINICPDNEHITDFKIEIISQNFYNTKNPVTN